jgi:hypothetical protein
MIISSIFLFLVGWGFLYSGSASFLGSLSIVFLLMVYVPVACEAAIELKSVSGVWYILLKMFLLMFLVTFLLEFVFSVILALVEISNPIDSGISVMDIPKIDFFFYAIWRFASVHALFMMVFEVIGIKGKKEKLAKEEDISPDQEE